MAICDPNANPAPPKQARVLTGGEITPEIQRYARTIAEDTSIPIGSIYRRVMKLATGESKPLIFWVSCHSYTQIGDQQIPGAFHGVSVYLDLAPHAGTVGESTDWGMVALSAGAVSVVIAGFFFALKLADRRPKRPKT